MMFPYLYPAVTEWKKLTTRPVFAKEKISEAVMPILARVRDEGDAALRYFTKKFDRVDIDRLQVSPEEITWACGVVPKPLQESIEFAIENVRTFHRSQIKQPSDPVETAPGVLCWTQTIPLESVGLYVPGGSAPLFSTVYMLGVPAQLAGVPSVSLCTPPNEEGKIPPAILFAANAVGITKIFKVGGAQAVAACAYGTESVPQVDKIFGPGNQYVAAAKELVARDGIAMDLPAGPSEVLVIADTTCVPSWVAADLIAQAEHGEDSQVVLVTDSASVLQEVQDELQKQLLALPRRATAEAALKKSFAVLLGTIESCIDFSNEYAPEHLILSISDPRTFVKYIRNAGSVFLGNYSPEVAGDYLSGPNHCLPTNGAARTYGGAKVSDFQKEVTVQELTKEGLTRLTPHIENLGSAEMLFGHVRAATIRMQKEFL